MLWHSKVKKWTRRSVASAVAPLGGGDKKTEIRLLTENFHLWKIPNRCLHTKFKDSRTNNDKTCHRWNFRVWPLWPWKLGQGQNVSSTTLSLLRSINDIHLVIIYWRFLEIRPTWFLLCWPTYTWKVGHIDLNFCQHLKMTNRCLHTKFKDSRTNNDETCYHREHFIVWPLRPWKVGQIINPGEMSWSPIGSIHNKNFTVLAISIHEILTK